MIEAILVVVGSVVAGTLLGLMPGRRAGWLGPIRTFALTAALGVVCVHMLPEAFHELGGWVFAGLVGGLLGPQLLGKLGAFVWKVGGDAKRASHTLALEASYFGLLVHQLGDGVMLGAYTGEVHSGHSHNDIIAALAAHAVPVVAIMVLSFDSVKGRGSALFRALGIALATIVGICFANSIPAHLAESWDGWMTAVIAGLLVHVVTHDLSAEAPTTARARSLDLLAAAAGFATSLLGESGHHDAIDSGAQHRIVDALVEISLDTAPLLLFGLAVGALIQAFGAKIPADWLRSRGVGWDALRGTVVGAPLPLCSCSVLPISESLNRRRAAPALVVAFLLAAPEISVEAFVLSVHFLGWPLAWVRLAGAVTMSFAAAVVVGWLARRPSSAAPDAGAPLTAFSMSETDFSLAAVWRRFTHAFDELLHHIGAWMVVGVVAAAFLQALLPAEALASGRGIWLDLLIVSAVAIPSYVCAPSATPLAAVLITKGLSPGVVLVALLLGPITNVVTLFFLRRWFGLRVTIAATLVVVVVSWSLAPAVNAWVPVSGVASEPPGHGHASVLALGFSILCGIALLRSIWLSGLRAWLASLQSDAMGGHAHGHGHAHGSHGHAHGHAFGHGHAHGNHGHAHGHALGHSHSHGSHELAHSHPLQSHEHAHGHTEPVSADADHDHAHDCCEQD